MESAYPSFFESLRPPAGKGRGTERPLYAFSLHPTLAPRAADMVGSLLSIARLLAHDDEIRGENRRRFMQRARRAATSLTHMDVSVCTLPPPWGAPSAPPPRMSTFPMPGCPTGPKTFSTDILSLLLDDLEAAIARHRPTSVDTTWSSTLRTIACLLDLADAKAGRLTARMAQVRITPLVESVIREHEASAEYFGVTMVWSCDTELLRADEGLLARLLELALSDALAHASPLSILGVHARNGEISVAYEGGPVPVDPFCRAAAEAQGGVFEIDHDKYFDRTVMRLHFPINAGTLVPAAFRDDKADK